MDQSSCHLGVPVLTLRADLALRRSPNTVLRDPLQPAAPVCVSPHCCDTPEHGQTAVLRVMEVHGWDRAVISDGMGWVMGSGPSRAALAGV